MVGVRIPCYRRWARADEIKEIAVGAEQMGYDSLWVQDHLVAPLGDAADVAVRGQSHWMEGGRTSVATGAPKTAVEYYGGDDWWLDPLAVWPYLAALTSRVRLCSDILVLPYRNPIVQAKMLGTVDVLSKGRLTIGTGSGHVAAESAVLGVDFAARADMHDEYIRIIKTVLGHREATFEGKYWSFGPMRTLIEPVQKPHPPILVGGNGKRAIRRAVELGDGWLPSMTSPADLAVGVEHLHAECERYGRRQIPTVSVSLPSGTKVFDETAAAHGGRRPPDIIRHLSEYKNMGVSQLSLGLPMPDLRTYMRQLELFASEVLPALQA